MKILIATSKAPTDEQGFKSICSAIRNLAEEHECKVLKGIYWGDGPGCSNLSFELEGEEDNQERVGKSLTMALMPSKWCETQDELPEEDTYAITK